MGREMLPKYPFPWKDEYPWIGSTVLAQIMIVTNGHTHSLGKEQEILTMPMQNKHTQSQMDRSAIQYHTPHA